MKQRLSPSAFAIVLMACLTLSVDVMAKTGSAEEQPFGERSIFSDRATQERIKPTGNLCMQGDDCSGGAPVGGATQVASNEPLDPEQVYNTKCMSCHAAGVAGAPKVGDVAAWSAKLEKGLDQVVKNAINGINAMPPKGLCMECSDEDIKNVVEYMVENSK